MIQLARDEILNCMHYPAVWFAFTKDEISPEEKAQLHSVLMASMRRCEFEWLSRQDGIIDAEMYESYAGAIPMILGTDRTRRWWKVYGHAHSFAPGFVSEVDKRLAEIPRSDYFESLDQW